MPRRNDIKKILLLGSGPIVIGQACEFDYSGTQALKALREEGYQTVLINSNPATIMTDPELADRTYIEPLTVQYVEAVIAKEKPCAILPTLGGQTALNLAIQLEELGILQRYNCKLLGADITSIKTAEDRHLFKMAMEEVGLECARSEIVHSVSEGIEVVSRIGLPVVLRPSRTLGGTGGGIVYRHQELAEKLQYALTCSPNSEVLIEESLLGWKEFELEVMRDKKDNVVIVCGIENVDPMGVHTGDSITVAPIQTLTDKEYQIMRDAAIKVMRRIGVDTGGSNVQFAVDPTNGRMVVIEMNPRVSRSSALASKATGFPIAKIAAKLAIGYTLDELSNDITKETPACFEPSIDYVVVKIPRFNFEKFHLAENVLGTQMKSVGEVLSFGRCFAEALQKAICSLEVGSHGFDREYPNVSMLELLQKLAIPSSERLWQVGEAFRAGCTVDDIFAASKIDRWFLAEIQRLIAYERELTSTQTLPDKAHLTNLKRLGFSDVRLAALLRKTPLQLREYRKSLGVLPVFKSVDTCAGEFRAETPYIYSTYDAESDIKPSAAPKIAILGSGPNRIGQGVEFDYCCVQAVFGLKEDGYKTIMINCNPETVSTDYDISDRLYFEPLTEEHVLNILDFEGTAGSQVDGVIVQFGGQTPLKLALPLSKSGIKIIGTSVDNIDIAEDRKRFAALVDNLKLKQPANGLATTLTEACVIADRIGYPLMIRPSFVLGGRAMRVLYNEENLRSYIAESVQVSNDRPVLLDRYLHSAIEVDVDALRDGSQVIIAGVMEHIEPAGIHSGDSSCSLPPATLSATVIKELARQTKLLADSLNVVGLINVQFAITRDQTVYILEANPRASRTIPFVGKATGAPWAKIAARVMAGQKLMTLKATQVVPNYYSVKSPIFPFKKFPGVDSILGPEMKSTGESMGVTDSFAGGFLRAQLAVGVHFPTSGAVFISVMDDDKDMAVAVAKKLSSLGFTIVATKGTTAYLKGCGINAISVNKVREGAPHIVNMIETGEIALVINTPEGSAPLLDSRTIRLAAAQRNVPTFTTMAGASSAVQAIELMHRINTKNIDITVKALQEYYA